MNEQSQTIFFPVSRFKLFVMSIVTFGFYQLFWFYKNWQLLKAEDESNISPFWRTVFGTLYCYPLLAKIKNWAKSRSVYANFSPLWLTVAWIGIIVFCRNLPIPYRLAGLLSVIALLPVQKSVNELNNLMVPYHDPNSRFSLWNIAAIAVGGGIIVLAIVGILMPPT
ncbi:hypothetical protein QUB63_12245 [Microcoleus sp. ARI1-B5]|uniref:hypothetical protein n=1 Tax=unclassified Microcoleus TaxID=2642155 RepID=UPI002FCF097D